MPTAELHTPTSSTVRKESRWQNRTTLHAFVTLTWTEKTGRAKTSKCRCIDIAQSGMSVVMPDRAEFRSFVHVYSRELGLVGQASVRNQRPEGMNYITGLEFLGGMVFRQR